MPPRTRATKSSKENIDVALKTNHKAVGKVTKPARKVLGDKTNSASDDNTSVEALKKPVKKTSAGVKSTQLKLANDKENRPRRERKLPSRFVENQLLNNLRSKENTPEKSLIKDDKAQTPIKNDSTILSPFKTPQKVSETSLITSRPKRVSRLPSRFEDHSISPSKFIPVQPFHASTPIVQKSSKILSDNNKENNHCAVDKSTKTRQQRVIPNNKQTFKTANVENKKPSTKNSKKPSADTNNNAQGRTLRARKADDVKTKLSSNKVSKIVKSPTKFVNSTKNLDSPVKKDPKPTNKNFSYRVLENNNRNESNPDVYEFTYDPNEEPPQKKKKKRVVKRKPAKPKTVVIKNNYDTNVNKALTALKNVVAKKQVKIVEPSSVPKPVSTDPVKVSKQQIQLNEDNIQTIPHIQRNIASKIIISNGSTLQQHRDNANGLPPQQQNVENNNNKDVPGSSTNIPNNSFSNNVPQTNKSVKIEDIAADFEPSNHDDLNYSPVNSPRPKTPTVHQKEFLKVLNENDPLNLRESFFDEQPVACSSMNVSARHPQASPWRVEFDKLPIRWHVNSYTKPNMTPAMECSFVNFDDQNKKKHVYTNILPENNEPLPEIVEKSAPNLIQTSIFSFIKEVVEKSSNKKKRGRSVTPATPQLFTDGTNKTPSKTANKNTESESNKATRQLFTPIKKTDKVTVEDTSKDTSNDKENSHESSKGQKRKHPEDPNLVPAKTPRKEKDNTFFGFDESENLEQENLSPNKNVDSRKRSLRPRARAVLKEINAQGPTRVVIPLAAKTRIAEVERLYDEMKSASDAPVFPGKEPVNLGTNVIEPIVDTLNEDDESVHLFEDIEVVHHLKPQRKSYGKAKKVAFAKNASDSDASDPKVDSDNSDPEDDLNDLTFDLAVPFIEEKKTKKKTNKKQKMTKKEKQEADAWAAGFNSMCEDVEEFDLIVE